MAVAMYFYCMFSNFPCVSIPILLLLSTNSQTLIPSSTVQDMYKQIYIEHVRDILVVFGCRRIFYPGNNANSANCKSIQILFCILEYESLSKDYGTYVNLHRSRKVFQQTKWCYRNKLSVSPSH